MRLVAPTVCNYTPVAQCAHFPELQGRIARERKHTFWADKAEVCAMLAFIESAFILKVVLLR